MMEGRPPQRRWRRRTVRIALRILYWAAVLAISIAILIGLILFFESRDSGQVSHATRLVPRLQGEPQRLAPLNSL